MYFVSSNPHSMVNLLSGTARRREDEVTAWVERDGPDDLRVELAAFRDGRTDGSWENFLYFSARDFFEAQPAELKERALGGGARGRHHPHLVAHRAARLRAGDRARLARPALARPAARRRRRGAARALPRR